METVDTNNPLAVKCLELFGLIWPAILWLTLFPIGFWVTSLFCCDVPHSCSMKWFLRISAEPNFHIMAIVACVEFSFAVITPMTDAFIKAFFYPYGGGCERMRKHPLIPNRKKLLLWFLRYHLVVYLLILAIIVPLVYFLGMSYADAARAVSILVAIYTGVFYFWSLIGSPILYWDSGRF